MGMVSSSFLSAPEQTINESNYIYHQQFSTLHNTSNNDKMPVIVDVMSIGSSEPKKRTKVLRTSVVNYGPISVRKRHSVAPTLATGPAPASLRHHEHDIQPKLEPWIPFHYYCADPSDQRRPPSPQ
ncbi:unnamed protein product [Rotaria socialis]|uniref:Uncharacterized protein n=1 Tax=Rotaria socialis TaxID=392032 RepID=A0A817W5K4_9BILA|nr:unnamed protein product [Rotaria socialis]